MPRKSRRVSADSPASDPIPVAEVLAASPIARIIASHEAKAQIEPEMEPGAEAVAAFLRQRERELAGEEPKSHVARLRKMQPPPAGFLSVATHAAAGIRVNKSLDRGTVAIQFDEAWKASRDGLVNEVETLGLNGFRFEPLRRQWERRDTAEPGANIISAGRLARDLAA